MSEAKTNEPKTSSSFNIKSLKPAGVCAVVTVVALIGAIISILTKNPLWILVLLVPATLYEAIRTQKGASTKASSIILLILLILEIILIVFNVSFDLTGFLHVEGKYIAGYYLPLGDIKIFGPLLLTILSTVLIFRTRGKYTRWLSIVIAVGSLTTIFLISPEFFQHALQLIVNGLLDRLSTSMY